MKLTKELPLIGLVLLPIVYLAYVWNDLPNKVPMHWNIQGEVDRYGSKSELLWLVLLLPILVYLLLLIVPKIDPKNKLQKMGKKYDNIKFFMTAFVSVLTVYIVYSADNQGDINTNYMIWIMGLLFIVLGNYFKTIKANYFIGIKTPWTLENEEVWRATHKLAGVLWFIGGILILVSSLIFENEVNFTIFITITALITFIPVVYSFVYYRKIKKQLQ